MTKDEALKLALDAFGEIAWSNETQWQRDRAKEAITAIKKALAQPEQEPVVVGRWPSAAIGKETLQDALKRENRTPPQRTWVNLTSEEIGEIYRVGWANNMELARAIEQKLKEKNVGTL